MAQALSDQQRETIWGDFMEWLSRSGETADYSKDDLRDAVDAADGYFVTNVDALLASASASLPAVFQGAGPAQVRTLLLTVLRVRLESGV